MQTYIPRLDSIRGMAALMVLFSHVYDEFPPIGGWAYALVAEGHVGVGLFFVLSGFVLAFGLYGKRYRLSGFALNRLVRIYPLFTAMIAVEVAIMAAAQEPVLLRAVLKMFAPITYNINPDLFFDAYSITNVFWSVSIEVQCYILVPTMLIIMDKNPVRVAMTLWFAFTLMRLGFYPMLGYKVAQLEHLTLLGRFDEFVIGMALGIVFRQNPETIRRFAPPLWLAMAVGIGAVTALHLAGSFDNAPAHVIYTSTEGFLAALIIAAAVAKDQPIGMIGEGLRRVGVISYSVYAIHLPLLHLVKTFSPMPLTFVTMSLILAPLTIIVAAATYATIERPAMRLRRRSCTVPATA